jgi:hypothetical protein
MAKKKNNGIGNGPPRHAPAAVTENKTRIKKPSPSRAFTASTKKHVTPPSHVCVCVFEYKKAGAGKDRDSMKCEPSLSWMF